MRSSLVYYLCVYQYIFGRGDNTQGGIIDVELYLDGVEFIGNSQNLTLVRVEFHFIWSLPSLEGVEVFLEYFRILTCPNGSVQEAVISKKSDFSAFWQVWVNVINVGKEEEGT